MTNFSLIHGDSVEVLKKYNSNTFDCCVTSPPYFFNKEYENYNNYRDYLLDIQLVADQTFRIFKPNSLAFININSNAQYPENAFNVLQTYKNCGFTFIQEIIWYRRNARMTRSHKRLADYKEYIFIFGKELDEENGYIYPENCLIETIDPQQKYGRYKPIGNVWDIPVQVGNQYMKDGNSASFPIEIPRNCMKLAGLENADQSEKMVIDPFVGTGTTILAGLELGINVTGIEIDAEYYDRALQRISKYNIEEVW